MKLKTPLPNTSMTLSELIAVPPGQQYTYGFYFKTENGPTYVGAQISLHDSNRKFLRNFASGSGGTTRDGEWQEYALPFVVPDGVAFIGCQTYKTYNTKSGGIVWADDFYLGEGLGLEQPPSPKKPFDGAHVRVDTLGNFEINKNGTWTPIFPLCMYSDNYRDWSVYSKQGWNTIIWTGAASQVKQAKESVSDFNPDGMLAGFSISQYTFPAGWAYNNLDDLRTKITEIYDQGLGDRLLLYYWDNEVNHDQWQVRLYNSIILGAKAMGYWRDCYKSCDENFMKSVGPADQKPWWPDFPNLRREVDQLLPIIREPHWTSWKASVDAPENVRVGTRDHLGEGYVILVNQTTKSQKVLLTLEGVPYPVTAASDVFTNEEAALAGDASFSVTLPKIGVGSGTKILRIVRAGDNR